MEEAEATSGRTLYLALRSVDSVPEVAIHKEGFGEEALQSDWGFTNILTAVQKWSRGARRVGEEEPLVVGMVRTDSRAAQRKTCKELMFPEPLGQKLVL